MVSFYSFYTTWAFLIGLGSAICLGFVVDKYHISGNDECDVTEYKLKYDLYSLIVFLLSSTIFTSFIQIMGYFGTRYEYNSTRRKIINVLIGLIFIVQILGICSMLYKFDKNHDCFDFYKDETNGKVMLFGFIGLSISYVLQMIFIIIGFISMCCCEKEKYSSFA
jgi:hypothetical protein